MSLLIRQPDERWSEVAPIWGGKIVVVIATGPSLTAEQVELVRAARDADRVRVIAVNDAYLWAPWADVCYFADSEWWEWQTAGVEKPLLGLTSAQVRERFAAFAGQKCSIQRAGSNIKDDAVHILRNKDFPYHGLGISLDPARLASGRNSGFQAVNLAVLSGGKDQILLGFDGKPAVDGKRHFFGEHPKITSDAVFEHMRRAFASAETPIKEAGVRIVNCTPGTAIDHFPKMSLQAALA